MKEYVEMTIEQALEYNNGNKNAKVIVAVRNLENDDDISSFVKKTKWECDEIIKRAQTIAHDCTEYVNSLYCYSAKQNLKEIKPIGMVSTILIKKE